MGGGLSQVRECNVGRLQRHLAMGIRVVLLVPMCVCTPRFNLKCLYTTVCDALLVCLLSPFPKTPSQLGAALGLGGLVDPFM